MGGSSSSKRKFSKKKTSKLSSQKKKRQRKESKKRRRNYDSVSDDESLDSEPTSSSSDYRRKRRRNKVKKLRREDSASSHSDDQSVSSDSDDNSYKSRRAGRSRISLKSRKKMAKKRYDSPGSDANASDVRKRKRKRSGKDRGTKPRKKSSKKKSRKYSSSSDSDSCSTCQSSCSSSSADGKYKKKRNMSDEEIERSRGRESYDAHRKRKARSPSCSSGERRYSNQSVSVDHDDGVLPPVNTYRRLRSVITVVDKPDDEEEKRTEMYQRKEEVVYDYDDNYPSPKSPDSNEAGNNMDLDSLPCSDFDKISRVENVVGEEVTELGKSGIHEGDQKNAVDHSNNIEKEKEIDDLETILRQKALENLMKFRGGPSSRRAGIVENKSTNRGDSDAQDVNQRSAPALEKDTMEKHPESEPVEQDSGIAKQTITHPGAALLGCSKEDKGSVSHAVFSEPVSGGGTSSGAGATDACNSSKKEPTSSAKPIGERKSGDQQDEAKDGSQYEQKTMSVMRGGEMVQVSYKVYIPKKAPGLARRQLRR